MTIESYFVNMCDLYNEPSVLDSSIIKFPSSEQETVHTILIDTDLSNRQNEN